jgi:hypothetical protein
MVEVNDRGSDFSDARAKKIVGQFLVQITRNLERFGSDFLDDVSDRIFLGDFLITFQGVGSPRIFFLRIHTKILFRNEELK